MSPSGNLKKLALAIGGWTFVVVGIIGLFLPILQGVLLLALGLVLLSLVSSQVRLMRQRLVKRRPALGDYFARARA